MKAPCRDIQTKGRTNIYTFALIKSLYVGWAFSGGGTWLPTMSQAARSYALPQLCNLNESAARVSAPDHKTDHNLAQSSDKACILNNHTKAPPSLHVVYDLVAHWRSHPHKQTNKITCMQVSSMTEPPAG